MKYLFLFLVWNVYHINIFSLHRFFNIFDWRSPSLPKEDLSDDELPYKKGHLKRVHLRRFEKGPGMNSRTVEHFDSKILNLYYI